MIATVVLLIAMTALAGLAAIMLTRGRQSRYMNIAETLASEKLEDLNRWNIYSQPICVPTGSTSEGSLVPTSTPTASISCTGETANTIAYYDDISIDFTTSSGSCGSYNNGCFAETISCIVGGVAGFCTTSHSPAGQIPGATDGSSNPVFTSGSTPPDQSALAFHRNWLIEANTPITGTRRITVLVTLKDQSVKPGVSVQMSMVRQ
jgi:hypothetical protein